MKKICFITTISATLKSFLLDTAMYLHNTGEWEVYMLCDFDEDFKNSLPDYIHYCPVKMSRGVNLNGIKAIRQMVKIFRKEKFDIIQYSTPNASLYASIAGKIANVPIRLYCQWGIVYVGFEGIKRKIFKSIEKFVCSLSTWIEPDSKGNLDFSHNEKLYPQNKGSVIWNGSACGIKLDKFDYTKKTLYRTEIRNKLSITEDAFVFGFVGRINRDKGINELLKAFKEINSDKLYLIFVGSDDESNTVDNELYSWSKSKENIIYCGVSNEVEKYLCAMDCYILPSYREGFGMGVIEAEAMGVPVIISDIPGPTDAMKNNYTGLIVKKKDANSLKDAMVYMTHNADDFTNNGVDFVKEHFDQRILLEKIRQDRENLLNKYGD